MVLLWKLNCIIMGLNLGISSSSYKYIAPVGGVTPPIIPSINLLLDDYPSAAAAYSLRKLRTAYSGSCIRVTRTSDLVQQDIGFVNNVLDLTTLQTFIGSSSASIVTWYDQSGNSRNATKSNALGQNLIIVSGTLQTINSLPAIYLPNLDVSNFAITGDLSYILVQRKITSNKHGLNVGSSASLGLLFSNWSDGNIYFNRSNGVSGLYLAVADSTTGNQILNAFNSSGTMTIYKNNTQYTTGSPTPYAISTSNFNNIGNASGSASNGYGAEVIIYTNSQAANRVGINTNINSFYSIF